MTNLTESKVPEYILNIPENYPSKVLPKPIDLTNAPPFSLDDYEFNKGQKEAIQFSLDYIMNPTEYNAICILGYAGTGKTFTMTKLIRYFIQTLKKNVAITAPTNKAVKVLKDNTEFIHSKMEHLTIHKLFGLKPQINYKTGKTEFVQSFGEDNIVEEFDILVVDEVSMLDDKLFGYIWNEVVGRKLKVIFMGDPLQIPPVNHKKAKPLIRGAALELKIGTVQLTEPVRQAADNPILKIATEIRSNHENPSYKPLPLTELNDRSGIITLNKSDRDDIYAICDKYFANEHFRNNPDFMKVITYRNVTADAVNTKIRSFIYAGMPIQKIMIGEKLIVDEPVKEGKTVVITVNAEIEVVEIKTSEIHVFSATVAKHFDLRQYEVKVKYLDKNNEPQERWINLIHDDSEEIFMKLLTTIEKMAKAEYDVYARKPLWQEYYKLKELFSWVKYNYCITCHKSQGSTYENAMVLLWDIDICQSDNPAKEKHIERNCIKYVAITRPKHLLITII